MFKQNSVCLRLSDIKFEMDSVSGTGVDEFDSDCLNGIATDSKDYIAIPFAEVTGQDPHSLFCGTNLDGKDLSCNLFQYFKLTVRSNFILFFYFL